MHKYDLNLREYWRIIKRRKLIILFTMVVMGVFSFISAILGKPVPIFKTNTTIQVLKSPHYIGAYVDLQLTGATNAMETQVHVIKSYYMLELTAKKMGLIPADLSPDEVRQNNKYVNIITDLQERVHTEQRGNSDLIDITVNANEPKFVTNFCNTLTDVYRIQHSLDLNRRTIEGKKFIEGQFALSKDKLAKAEDAVKQFRIVNKWTSVETETSYVSGQINRLQDLYGQDTIVLQKVNAAERMLATAENTPLTSSKSFYFDEAPGPYKALNERLVNLMLERDTLLLNYTSDFPQVMAIKMQIHEIVESMRSHLRAQQRNLASNIRIYRQQLAELNGKLREIPQKHMIITRLGRDADIAKELYVQLEKRYQDALIGEAEKTEEVKVVKPAIEPASPINPPKVGTNTILGTMLGLILGIVFAFLIETFDTSIGAIEEVEEFLGIHVMGIIPFVSYEEIKTLISDDPNAVFDENKMRRYARLAAHFVPSSTLSESYKALRTSLNFLCTENNLKTILFTSSSPGEGKTSIVVNVAITMAQIGQKVLLIDGDLRRPVISKLFGIEQIPGLTDVILGNHEWQKVVRTVADFITGKMSIEDIMKTPGMDNLNIITSGTYSPNPAEILNSKAIGEFINRVRNEYDVVLIDAPPVLAATDAALWSSRVDGSVLVYQVGKIARGALKRSKISLENLKANVLGVVLNGLKAEISPDFGEDYYYYYYRQDKAALPFHRRVLEMLKPQNLFSRRRRRKKSAEESEFPVDEKKAPAQTVEPPEQEQPEPESGTAALSEEEAGTAKLVLPQQVERKTPIWIKTLMLVFLVLLLVAGVYYQMGGFKKHKLRISAPPPPANEIIIPASPESSEVPGPKETPPATPGDGIKNSSAPDKGNPAPAGQIKTEMKSPSAPIVANSAPPAGRVKDKTIDSSAPAGENYSSGKQADSGQKAPLSRTGASNSPAAREIKAPPAVTQSAPAAKPGGNTKTEAQRISGAKLLSIQVKSVPTPEEARRLMEELKGKGEEAFAERVTIKGRGEWSRIFIGRFSTAAEAEKFMKENKFKARYPGCIVQKISEGD